MALPKEDTSDELSVDPLGPDVQAALGHVIAARLRGVPLPPLPKHVSGLQRPYKLHLARWRKRALMGSGGMTLLVLFSSTAWVPLAIVCAVGSVAAGLALAAFVMAEILVGAGVEVEEQYVTPGPEPRYDRFNFFRPSIRTLPSLLLLLASSIAGVVIGFGGLFAQIEKWLPGSFTPEANAWFFFSLVTFATVGYGDIAPQAAVARSVVAIEICIAIGFNAVVLTSTISWLVTDARLRHDARDRARGARMRRREQWIKDAKLGLYANPSDTDALFEEAKATAAGEPKEKPAT
jgi:hypothetical protein